MQEALHNTTKMAAKMASGKQNSYKFTIEDDIKANDVSIGYICFLT